MTKPVDDREYRLNNLGQLEQYLGGAWIAVQTARARENNNELINPHETHTSHYTTILGRK